MSHQIRLIQGDITQLQVDAIVNAANTSPGTVRSFLRAPGSIEKVTFVVFDKDNFLIYNKALS